MLVAAVPMLVCAVTQASTITRVDLDAGMFATGRSDGSATVTWAQGGESTTWGPDSLVGENVFMPTGFTLRGGPYSNIPLLDLNAPCDIGSIKEFTYLRDESQESTPGGLSAAQYGNKVRVYTSQSAVMQYQAVVGTGQQFPDAGGSANASISQWSRTANPDGSLGYVYYRIEPVLNEALGDPVALSIDGWYSKEDTPAEGYGVATSGGLGAMGVRLNGVDIGLTTPGNGGESIRVLNAHIGDVIGVQLSAQASYSGSGVIPDYGRDTGGWYSLGAVNVFASVILSVPRTPGLSASAPLMPITSPTSGDPYVFHDIEVGGVVGIGTTCPLWFDPEVAIGYRMEITNALVTRITMPNTLNDLDGFKIWLQENGQWVLATEGLMPGGTFLVPGNGTTLFKIDGIDTALELDPTNTNAFPVGLTFANAASGVNVLMTPLTQNVPEPTSLALLSFGVVVLLRRRR